MPARLLFPLLLLAAVARAETPRFSSAPSVASQTPCYAAQAQPLIMPNRPTESSDAAVIANYQYWVDHKESLRQLDAQLECLAFTYTVDGLTVDGHMVKPKRAAGNKLPVLVYNRGGNIRDTPLSPQQLVRDQMQWAKQGYIVISSQYRGRGHDEFGGRDVNDVLALLPIIDGMPDADADRIGMFGISRGSIMTYLSAARSKRIKAIAIWGGVSDLLTEVPRRPEMERLMARLIPEYAANREQALKDRSVLYWMERLDPGLPVLLLHGDADVQVSVVNATAMAQKLKERGQPHKLVIYPNGDHALVKYRKEVLGELMGWFNQYL
jgi:dipeptidyl aminopeptidase/acylaminoacyl peptidase